MHTVITTNAIRHLLLNTKPIQQETNNTKLRLLQSQNDVDKSRIKSQEDKLRKILSLHNEYKTRYESVKKELQLTQHENEEYELRITDLEECCSELNQGNRYLEDKVRMLCELNQNQPPRTADGNEKGQHTQRRRSSVVDVWQQLEDSRKLNRQKDLELQHAHKKLQLQMLDNQAQRTKIDELSTKAAQYLQRIRVLEYQIDDEGKTR